MVWERVTYPNVEVEVLVCDRLDVEPDSRYRGDDLADLQSVQQRRLASVILHHRSLLAFHGSIRSAARGRRRTKPRINILISFFAHIKLDSHDIP